MYNKYLIEYMGTLVVITSLVISEADPIVMGIIYFSVFWMTSGLTNGYFNPLGPLVILLLKRGEVQDMIYNLLSQIAAAVSVYVLIQPVTVFINQI